MACEIETRDMDEYERGVIFRLDACCRRPRARQGARSAAVPKGAVALTGLSAARVGEHIVKGTCHICHDATGPGGGHSAMAQGIIPSLASIPRDHSLNGVVHQVQYGSSGMMKMAGAEVMPAYPYFTQEEIAAA